MQALRQRQHAQAHLDELTGTLRGVAGTLRGVATARGLPLGQSSAFTARHAAKVPTTHSTPIACFVRWYGVPAK